jgi:hypothetical protein
VSYIEIADVDGCLLRAGSAGPDPGAQLVVIPHSLLPDDGEPAGVVLEAEDVADLMVYLVGRLDSEGRGRVIDALLGRPALSRSVPLVAVPGGGIEVAR